MQRFEGLLDRILRQGKRAEAAGERAERGYAAAAAALLPPAESPRPLTDLTLSARSLAASFWALGNMRYPLSQEQLDKIAGGAGRGCAAGAGVGASSACAAGALRRAGLPRCLGCRPHLLLLLPLVRYTRRRHHA